MGPDRAPSAPALVILAAGASTRLGQHKALAELRGEPAIVHLLRAGRALGDPAPLVITGADEGAIGRTLAALDETHPPELVHNPDWSDGRGSGLMLAATLRAGRDVCVAPVDCPLVSPQVFEALAQAWAEADRPATGWLGPRLGPRLGEDPDAPHGHPVLLGRNLLSNWDGRGSLRNLRQGALPLLSVAVEDPAILDNLDRPEDLVRLRAR
ncbi:MAG: NTP transferase domain-containing protein [Planctomycetota bacterium]|nr:NTP transferase domain-containing protein [Planctomycetota bacterium]MDP6939761.1 NTP transferase domain-containing protein [Planctomycetota bacterium]